VSPACSLCWGCLLSALTADMRSCTMLSRRFVCVCH
jgi:hypothetical protein